MGGAARLVLGSVYMRYPNPLRALISGAGAAGHLHAMAYRALGVEVVGVYDPDPTFARWLAQMHDAEAEASPAALFAREAECVSLAGPPPSHAAQTRLAAREGRIVFVEKPVATSVPDLERLRGLPGFVVPVVQWRAGRALRAVRAAVARGSFGPSPSAVVDLAWSRDEDYFAKARGTREGWGGGVLLSVGVHAVDAVTWAFGRRIVGARGALRRRSGIGVETTGFIDLTFEGGAVAAVRATFDGGGGSTRFALTGNGITAVIEGGEMDPTAGRVAWSASEPHVLASLRALEERCDGALEPPLHIAFMRTAIAAAFDGPGVPDALPLVDEAHDAHAAILRVYASELGETGPSPGDAARDESDARLCA